MKFLKKLNRLPFDVETYKNILFFLIKHLTKLLKLKNGTRILTKLFVHCFAVTLPRLTRITVSTEKP